MSRIAVGLPVVLERALGVAEREREREKRKEWTDWDGRVRRKEEGDVEGQGEGEEGEGGGVFPRNVMFVAKAVDVALERMERMLK